MFDNIPVELRALRQWVVVSAHTLPDGKRCKIPLNPRTGLNASVTDPSTWGSFDEAVASGFPCIGFVLTADDPYTIIDLDDPDDPTDAVLTQRRRERHAAILKAFEHTYAEMSLSDRGVHIVTRDRTGRPAIKLSRDKVEMYFKERYMIFTGRKLDGHPLEIADCSELLDSLTLEMGRESAPSLELVQVDSMVSDDEILRVAWGAKDGQNFARLWEGRWKEDPEKYPSQSEADYALLGLLKFYTLDNEQCRRLFRRSQLNRPKATDAYLNRALKKLREKDAPPMDFTEFMQNISRLETFTANEPEVTVFQFPQGLVGELAEYFLASAAIPVREIALAAALALMAGITGRQYNINGGGLNLWILIVARTGRGKEGAADGIDRVINALRVQKRIPDAGTFLGPSAFASGVALHRTFAKRPCFVSPLGEVGILFQQMFSPRAPSHLVMFKRTQLDTFGKSGWGRTVQGGAYASEDNDLPTLFSPCASFIGDTTPEILFDSLGASAIIAEGYISRWQTMEYDGPRAPLNLNMNFPPPDEMLEKLAVLTTDVLLAQGANRCRAVAMSPEAKKIFTDFEEECREHVNATGQAISEELWNRAHLKALKVSALVAVGRSWNEPTIQEDDARWAIGMIKDDVTKMHSRFTRGDVGLGDPKREADVRRHMLAWFEMSPEQRTAYSVPTGTENLKMVPKGFLLRRCRACTSFVGYHGGETKGVTDTINNMVESGQVTRSLGADSLKEFGVRCELIGPGPEFPEVKLPRAQR